MTEINQNSFPKSMSEGLLAESIREAGAEVYEVEFKDILFDPYVQMKCQNCPGYGSNLRCPPHTPRYYEAKATLEKYTNYYLVLIHEDRTEWMNEIREKHPNYSEKQVLNITSRNWNSTSYWKQYKLMLAIKKYLSQSSTRTPLILGAGGACKLCRICGVHEGKICKKPDRTMASPESWGIDVYGTCTNLDLLIEIPPRRLYTRVGVIGSERNLPTSILLTTQAPRLRRGNAHKRFKELMNDLRTNSDVLGIEVYKEHLSHLNFEACSTCSARSIFLCNRSFLPESDVISFLERRRILLIQSGKMKRNAKWTSQVVDTAHRYGFYDALAFSDTTCDICLLCSENGCGLSQKSNSKQHGKKEAFRCVGYIGMKNQLLSLFKNERVLILVLSL